MAENFTTYTLLDSGNDCITVNSATSLSIAGTTNDRYSLHSDKGAAHFSGDFEHIVTTSGSARGVVVRKADIDAYGYDEALRRACIEAGEPVPEEIRG